MDEDAPQRQYYLFTDKKAFLERLETKVATQLPDINIIQVTDDFFNDTETINQRNLKL